MNSCFDRFEQGSRAGGAEVIARDVQVRQGVAGGDHRRGHGRPCVRRLDVVIRQIKVGQS